MIKIFQEYSMIQNLQEYSMIKIFQEYSMIMSERDSVHKEIEKLQDDVSNTNSKMKEVSAKYHKYPKRFQPNITFIVKVIIPSSINQIPKLSTIVINHDGGQNHSPCSNHNFQHHCCFRTTEYTKIKTNAFSSNHQIRKD